MGFNISKVGKTDDIVSDPDGLEAMLAEAREAFID
jgi:hypothetical protein